MEVYRIAVARDKLVFQADVPRILGIAQAGKWDVARLPFDDGVRGSAIGVKFGDVVTDGPAFQNTIAGILAVGAFFWWLFWERHRPSAPSRDSP